MRRSFWKIRQQEGFPSCASQMFIQPFFRYSYSHYPLLDHIVSIVNVHSAFSGSVVILANKNSKNRRERDRTAQMEKEKVPQDVSLIKRERDSNSSVDLVAG